MHLFVDTQPSFLFIRGQQIHDLREIVDDVLPDFLDKCTAFFRDFHKNFAPVIGGVRALHIAEILEAVHQSGRRSRRMVHLFRNLTHRKKVVCGDVSEQKKLRKGNLAPRKLLGKPEHQTTLERHHDVCKPFNIRTHFRSLQLDHDRFINPIRIKENVIEVVNLDCGWRSRFKDAIACRRVTAGDICDQERRVFQGSHAKVGGFFLVPDADEEVACRCGLKGGGIDQDEAIVLIDHFNDSNKTGDLGGRSFGLS